VIWYPRTRAEAEAHRYHSLEHDFDSYVCAAEIRVRGLESSWQCARYSGHGPDKLFCRLHAKMIAKEASNV